MTAKGPILVTGVAGFIGAAAVERLHTLQAHVQGLVDNGTVVGNWGQGELNNAINADKQGNGTNSSYIQRAAEDLGVGAVAHVAAAPQQAPMPELDP